MAKIVFENVTKKFGSNTAINDLNMEVGDGSFVSLLGEPGAGKTTLLRMISGLEVPTSGNIYIDDVRVNKLSPAERDVAWFTVKGLSMQEIARMRETSDGTVKAQSNAIYRKAGVSGRYQLLSQFVDELMIEAGAAGRPSE